MTLMRFWQKLSCKFFLLASLPLILCYCSSSLPPVNEAFEKKYGKEVEQIKIARTPAPGAANQSITTYPPTPEELRAEQNSAELSQNYYPYVDVTKFGERAPQNYLPNGEVYEQGVASRRSNALPEDMFEITYNVALYPPFRVSGKEFDAIKVPPADVYGVPTEMSSKSYLLAGNDSLQRNIDKINSEKSADDIEISETLIKEQKQLKRKEKMIKIFGKNSLEIASLEKKEDKQKPSQEQKSSDAPKPQDAGQAQKAVKN